MSKKFNPADISGLIMWLDANDIFGDGTKIENGDLVSTWYDKSMFNYKLVICKKSAPIVFVGFYKVAIDVIKTWDAGIGIIELHDYRRLTEEKMREADIYLCKKYGIDPKDIGHE